MNRSASINGPFGGFRPSVVPSTSNLGGVAHSILAQIDRLAYYFPNTRFSIPSIHAGVSALAKMYHDAVDKQLEHEQTVEEQKRTIESKDFVIGVQENEINSLKTDIARRDLCLLQSREETTRLSGSIKEYEELVELAWEEFGELKEVAAKAQTDLVTSQTALQSFNDENERLIIYYNSREDAAFRRERAVLTRIQVLRNQIYELERRQPARNGRDIDDFYNRGNDFNVQDGLGSSSNMDDGELHDDSGFADQNTYEPRYESESDGRSPVSSRFSDNSYESCDSEEIQDCDDDDEQWVPQSSTLTDRYPKDNEIFAENDVEDELSQGDDPEIETEDETCLERLSEYEEIERQQRYAEEIDRQEHDPDRPSYRSGSQSSYGPPPSTPCSTPDLMSHNDTYPNCLLSVEDWVGERFIGTEEEEAHYRVQISREQRMRWASTDIPPKPRGKIIEKRKRGLSGDSSDVDDNEDENNRNIHKRQRI